MISAAPFPSPGVAYDRANEAAFRASLVQALAAFSPDVGLQNRTLSIFFDMDPDTEPAEALRWGREGGTGGIGRPYFFLGHDTGDPAGFVRSFDGTDGYQYIKFDHSTPSVQLGDTDVETAILGDMSLIGTYIGGFTAEHGNLRVFWDEDTTDDRSGLNIERIDDPPSGLAPFIALNFRSSGGLRWGIGLDGGTVLTEDPDFYLFDKANPYNAGGADVMRARIGGHFMFSQVAGLPSLDYVVNINSNQDDGILEVLRLQLDLAGDTADNFLRCFDGGAFVAGIRNDGQVFGQKAQFTSLPTSASGLAAGEFWNDSGTVKVA